MLSIIHPLRYYHVSSFVHVSTSQRVNKNCTKLEIFFFFFLMMLYSSFVINTLKKFTGAATGAKHTSSKYSGRIKDI